MVITKTPYRISFFGGGTDYPAWYREHGGAVIATTINRYVRLSCRYLPPFFHFKHRIVYSTVETPNTIEEINHPAVRAVLTELKWDRGLELHYDGDLPARSGMGSSSAFTVGLINGLLALRQSLLPKAELSRMALHIEQQVLKENVGSQDQICAAFGGFNRIEFFKNGTFHVSPIIATTDRIAELESCLLLVFTGLSRNASDIAKAQLDNIDRKADLLHRLRSFVDEGIGILQTPRSPLSDFGKLLHESWQVKRTLSDQVTNPKVDETYQAALQAGAIGGKLLGAGAGGFMLLFVPPAARAKVSRRLEKLIQVPFRFEANGSQIIVYHQDELEAKAA
jgi:D-glycero-alpha-D-manno-heptose-7-phosphate kinase